METAIDFGSNNGLGSVGGFQINNGQINIGSMRPFAGKDGRQYMSVYKGGDPKLPTSYSVQPTGLQVNELTLRRDEWKQLDSVLLPAAQTRLNGIQDLVDNGLVFNLNNAMGTTVLEWHSYGGEMTAVVSMDGVTRGQNNRPITKTNYLPIPIIHADYEINARTLAMTRGMGNWLEVSDAEMAARAVAVQLENMLFTDTQYAFGNGNIYSYLNYPDASAVTLDTHWDHSGKTGAQILADVQEMMAASVEDLHYGPWALYIPTTYNAVLNNDYSSTKGVNTIRERLLQLDNLKSIKAIDTLPADTIVLVQMTSDVVRLVRGLGIQNVQWQVEGNMITKYKVMTIQVPQIRSDINGKSGIVIMS